MILAGSNSLPLRIVGVNKALYGREVKPPVGFLPWQKLGDSRKCSRRGNTGLGNQSRGNFRGVQMLTELLRASMLYGLYRSFFELL